MIYVVHAQVSLFYLNNIVRDYVYLGLNAAANHGYIPRNGIVNFTQVVKMQKEVYNFDDDIANVLAIAGVVADGDLTTLKFSIGGSTTKTSLTKTISSAGLDYHGVESDASPRREDFFLINGDGFSFNSANFALTYNAAQKYGHGNYNFEAMTEAAYQSVQRSMALNPQFFFGTVQIIFHYAAHAFYSHIFPNGTDGIASPEIINSFIGVVDNGDGTFSHIPERIPPNWYHRPEPYSLIDLFTDIIAMELAHPVASGANDGKNNYVPDNLDSTDGTLPLPADLDARGLGCIFYQASVTFVPNMAALLLLKSILDPIFVAPGAFNCRSLIPKS